MDLQLRNFHSLLRWCVSWTLAVFWGAQHPACLLVRGNLQHVGLGRGQSSQSMEAEVGQTFFLPASPRLQDIGPGQAPQ